MHAPTGGWARPATTAHATIAPCGAPAGSSATATMAAAATGAPARRSSVCPRRSATRPSTGFDSPSASAYAPAARPPAA